MVFMYVYISCLFFRILFPRNVKKKEIVVKMLKNTKENYPQLDAFFILLVTVVVRGVCVFFDEN